MQRTVDDLLRTAAKTAERAVAQLQRDQAELAKSGLTEGEAVVADAFQAARRVADLLNTSTTPERS